MTTKAALQLLEAKRAAKLREREAKKAAKADGSAPKENKFGAQRVTLEDGQTFDSKREASRWVVLDREARTGNRISDLRRQVKIPLLGRDGPILTDKGNPAHYVADFVYFDAAEGREVIEDAKGFRTKDYRLKRGILAAQGITIKET